MRRIAAFSCSALLAFFVAGTAGAQRADSTSWAAPQIATVVAQGLLAKLLEQAGDAG